MPPFNGTMPLSVSGFAVQGALLVNPATSVSPLAGVFGPGGSVVHALAIPNQAAFAGLAWEMQSIDLAMGGGVLSLADDELAIVLAGGPPASLNMVPISAGTFLMGSPEPVGVTPYYNRADSQPIHAVTIARPFWIGKYEVTQSEYQAVTGSNPSTFLSANRPVEGVTWYQAVAYCDALTVRELAAGRLPSGYEYRLPTEAEWEYCCRAGTATEFHYGPTLVCGQANFDFSTHTNSVCNSWATLPVGGYAPNAWGLYDMHGNVWEWCLDGWDGYANYPGGSVSDPYVAPYAASGLNRIFRGGSMYDISAACRSAYRGGTFPGQGYSSLGFRVVCAPVR